MRHKPAPKRKLIPDQKYKNLLVAKLINYIMRRGKKSTAARVIYNALEIVAQKSNSDPVEALEGAIKNISPVMEVRSRRVGGANYQIPVPVRGERRLSLALRWMIGAANAKKGRPMADKLAQEIMEASKNEGAAVKKRMDVHRMAEANRAFAHFARF